MFPLTFPMLYTLIVIIYWAYLFFFSLRIIYYIENWILTYFRKDCTPKEKFFLINDYSLTFDLIAPVVKQHACLFIRIPMSFLSFVPIVLSYLLWKLVIGREFFIYFIVGQCDRLILTTFLNASFVNFWPVFYYIYSQCDILVYKCW